MFRKQAEVFYNILNMFITPLDYVISTVRVHLYFSFHVLLKEGFLSAAAVTCVSRECCAECGSKIFSGTCGTFVH